MWINLWDNAPPGFFDGAVKDPTPCDEDPNIECPRCDGLGRDHEGEPCLECRAEEEA